MGKKGAKRKTRWRTLSIGTPPGEEDEEEGSRNGYLIKSNHELVRASSERNGYGPPWLKSRHGSAGSSGSGNSNGQGSTTSGYGSGGSRSRRICADGLDSPSQPQPHHHHHHHHQHQQRIAFNEEEYTRITTPRQDILFKKGYLGQKKPWTRSNASMSATPSTTESQSASHSTADGSEAAEDQQLLDTGVLPAEYAPQLMEPMPPGPAQMSYGTYYDHTSGYFYEYPMMLLGPAIPDKMGQSNMLAAMPCAPVPLRPIEWVNPAFVPKLASQQYCYMDYQGAPTTDCATLVDAQALPLSTPELAPDSLLPTTNGLSNEPSLTGGSASASASASASGSLADEPLVDDKLTLIPEHLPNQELIEHQEPMQEITAIEDAEKLPETEELLVEEAPDEGMEYVEAAAVPVAPPYVETLPAQPVHLAHMMPPPMGHQPYLYPGQYMFGPPVVNVNGVTIQSGPMLICNDMLANTAAAACAKRRKKKKKRKHKRPHALGNSEDEDEEDYRSEGENGFPSPRVSWSAAPSVACSLSNRPLNPECQEFQLRSGLADSTPESFSDSCGTSSIPATTTTTTTSTSESNGEAAPEDECNYHRHHHQYADNEEATTRLTDESAETVDVDSKDLENGTGHNLTNGCVGIEEKQKHQEEEDMTKSCRTNNGGLTAQPKRKYSAKAFKFIREATPGPDLGDETNNCEEAHRDLAVDELTLVFNTTTIIETQASQNDADLDICQSRANEESPPTIASESCSDEMRNHETTTKTTTTIVTESITTVADEDSGFESQSKHGYSGRPITDAVNEWLKRANSPDLFITSSATSDVDEDEVDEEEASLSNEPSKNLQGNPMPALSVNGAGAEKREARRGKIAETGESSTGSSNDEAVKVGSPSFKGSRNVRGARRKGVKSHRRNEENQFSKLDTQQNKLDTAQEQAQVSAETFETPAGKALDGDCDSAEKDSDVGMRVAENSRIDVRRLEEPADSTVIHRALEEACKEKCMEEAQTVRTFEKGEIIVSMDGELLLVASELRDKDTVRRNSDSILEDEHRSSLGSIEEPDVLECWEAETVEPVVSPKKALEVNEDDNDDIDDLLVTKDNGPDDMEHVQRYYRLQADSSVSSVEDETRDNLVVHDNLDASRSKTVPNTPDRMTDSVSSIEEIPVILPLEEKSESITDYSSKLPIDEAFEVYESYYTGKPLTFASIDPKFVKSPFMSRDEEGPIPCKAVCCNIQ